jgi:hypothetical protein
MGEEEEKSAAGGRVVAFPSSMADNITPRSVCVSSGGGRCRIAGGSGGGIRTNAYGGGHVIGGGQVVGGGHMVGRSRGAEEDPSLLMQVEMADGDVQYKVMEMVVDVLPKI